MKKLIELKLKFLRDGVNSCNSIEERDITINHIAFLEELLVKENDMLNLEWFIISLNCWKNIDEWNIIKLDLRDYLKKLYDLIKVPEKCPYRLYACGEFACKLGKGNINPLTNDTYSYNPKFCAGCDYFNPGEKKEKGDKN